MSIEAFPPVLPSNYSLEAGGNLAAIAAAISGGRMQVSVATLPLPSNAAQEAGGNLAAILAALTTGPVPVSVAALPLPANAAKESGGNLATLAATVSGGMVQVSAASLPLPGNAAKETGGNLATIASNTSGLALEAGGNLQSIESNTAALDLAQNSSTSGQTGPLVQGAVTTSAPSYNTGKTSPLSLTTSGGLRVDGSATTQPVSWTSQSVTANQGTAAAALSGAWPVKMTDGSNVLGTSSNPVNVTCGVAASFQVTANQSSAAALQATVFQTTPASLQTLATTNADTTIAGTSAPSKGLLVLGKTNDGTPVYDPFPLGTTGRSVIIEGFSGGTAVPTAPNPLADATATATLSNTSTTAQITMAGYSGAAVQYTGSAATATLVVEGSPDGGTTWEALPLFADGGASGTSISLVSSSATDCFQVGDLAGQGLIRARLSAFSSGSVAVELRATVAPSRLNTPYGTQTVSGTVSALQSGTWNINGVTTVSTVSTVGTVNTVTALTGITNTVDVNAKQWGGTALTAAATVADGTALPTSPLVGAVGQLYNGTTVDLARGNTQGTLLASGARTTAQSVAVTNYNARGILLFLNITVASGTGGLRFSVQVVDPVSGGACNLMAPTPTGFITTTGLYAIMVYPGDTATPQGSSSNEVNAHIPAALPRNFNVAVQVGDASSYTYSLGYALMV